MPRKFNVKGKKTVKNIFSEKHSDKYLKGYIKHKPNKYEFLENAIDNSNKYNDVGGITFSEKKKYTLRKGKSLKHSPSGESSWIKLNETKSSKNSIVSNNNTQAWANAYNWSSNIKMPKKMSGKNTLTKNTLTKSKLVKKKHVTNSNSYNMSELERIQKCAYSLHTLYPSLSDWSDSKKLAALLCFNDRYGSQGSLKYIKSDEIKKVLKIIKTKNNKIKSILSDRTDFERIQCQRPIYGDSLLSITGPENTLYSKQLNALLVLAMDTHKGVIGYQIGVEKDNNTGKIKINKDAMNNVPFKIFRKLQPDQPSPENPKIEATNINIFLKKIFNALQHKGTDEFKSFVESNSEILEKLGLNSSSRFSDDMKYYTFIAKATPGKQLILWSTWHATGSSNKDNAKISSFIDIVPKNLLDKDSQLWYNFVCQNAPYDPGSGSARGSWTSFDVLSKKDVTEYGIPQAKIKEIWEQKSHGSFGKLSSSDMTKFKTDGYLIIDIPEELQTEFSATQTVNEFDDFFSVLSDEPSFSFKTTIKQLVETGKKDDYNYFMDRIDNLDPFNPIEYNKTTRKSHNPQSGGKYIANDSGMGPGSTFLNSPTHLGFQFSQWVTNLFASFYGEDEILLRVLERFRVKMMSGWSKSAHVDIDGKSIIESGLIEQTI
jgi:hypothetical protein